MTFKSWLAVQGGPKVLAPKLGVSEIAVYKWMQGKATPKSGTLMRILRMARGKLTITEIFNARDFGKTGAK
jgi:DNA-binding transcriptional regulator YdaS (Cro superfamily)